LLLDIQESVLVAELIFLFVLCVKKNTFCFLQATQHCTQTIEKIPLMLKMTPIESFDVLPQTL